MGLSKALTGRSSSSKDFKTISNFETRSDENACLQGDPSFFQIDVKGNPEADFSAPIDDVLSEKDEDNDNDDGSSLNSYSVTEIASLSDEDSCESHRFNNDEADESSKSVIDHSKFAIGPSLDIIGCRRRNVFDDKFDGLYCIANASANHSHIEGALKNLDRSDQAPCQHNSTLMRRKAAAKKVETAGSGWFGMPAPELTEELKNDFRVIRNRGYLDPTRHYKKENNMWPKYFSIGTVIEGKHEFFSSRVAKRDRKQTIAEEIMADSRTTDYMKRKFHQIQAEMPNRKKLKSKKRSKRYQ